MKKNIFTALLVFTALFAFSLNAFAVITSVNDIKAKISKVERLTSYNYRSLYNKSELIGNRLELYNFHTEQLRNEASQAAEKLRGIIDQIELLNENAEISDFEKQTQIKRLYKDADITLNSLNTQAFRYLTSMRDIMPTLTYGKYAKKFADFYNSLEIGVSPLNIR